MNVRGRPRATVKDDDKVICQTCRKRLSKKNLPRHAAVVHRVGPKMCQSSSKKCVKEVERDLTRRRREEREREERQLPFCFVADEAFPLRETIMRPCPGRQVEEEDDMKKRIFNYRLCRARRVVENSFGILVTKWRIFRQPIIAKTSTVDKIVHACCVRHNYLRRRDGVSNDGKTRSIY